MEGFITAGVNVRPRKPRFESCPPRGIVTSGSHWTPPPPRRRHRNESKRLQARNAERELAQRITLARAEAYAAQDRIRELKAAGVVRTDPVFRAAAAESRQARQKWQTLAGERPTAQTIEVAQASDANKIKAA